MDDERIELSLDDLEDEPAPAQGNRLVITGDDLDDLPEAPSPMFSEVPVAGDSALSKLAKTGPSAVAVSALLQGLIAGAIGGFIGWAVLEPFVNDGVNDSLNGLTGMGFFGGIIGGMIGAALGAVDGILNRQTERAVRGGLIGLGIGFGGGFIGGVAGQIVYAALMSGMPMGITQIFARAAGWALVGTFVGLGQGVATRSKRKIMNALIGGFIGGTVGGGFFDVIGMVTHGGNLSRIFAITVLGACAGAAISLVEELRKTAWLHVAQGWLAGKQFILHQEVTTIGSSPKCDIYVFKDSSVLPQHAVIRAEPGYYRLQSTAPNAAIEVNRQPVNHKVLRNGDTIRIGDTVFVYSEKTAV